MFFVAILYLIFNIILDITITIIIAKIIDIVNIIKFFILTPLFYIYCVVVLYDEVNSSIICFTFFSPF